MAGTFLVCRSITKLNLRKQISRPLILSERWYLKSNVVSSPETTTSSPESNVTQSSKDPLDLSFENTVEAFKSKTTWEIIRAILVLRLSTIDYLVENHEKVCIYIFFVDSTYNIPIGLFVYF